MNDDIDEAKDWLGRDIDCASCAHHDTLLPAGRCRLKHACVLDRYAKRIDRFFNWNPQLGDSYVSHEHFEVRAIRPSTPTPSCWRRCSRTRGDGALERRAPSAETAHPSAAPGPAPRGENPHRFPARRRRAHADAE